MYLNICKTFTGHQGQWERDIQGGASQSPPHYGMGQDLKKCFDSKARGEAAPLTWILWVPISLSGMQVPYSPLRFPGNSHLTVSPAAGAGS